MSKTIIKRNLCQMKLFGITLYVKNIEKKQGSKTAYLVSEFLSGILKIRYDFLAKTFKMRLFNIGILKTRLKGSFRILNFLFFPIWARKINDEFLNAFLDKITLRQPKFDDYYVFLMRSGEFFLLMHHFKQWLERNKSSNFALIFTSKSQLNICRMFYPEMPAVYMKRVEAAAVLRDVGGVYIKHNGKNIYIPAYDGYFHEVEDRIKTDNAHYYECLKEHLNLSVITGHYNITERAKAKAEKIIKERLNNNFVLISPETLSNELLSKDFWNCLCRNLKYMGYEVFCNLTDEKYAVDGTVWEFLTYEEAIALSKYAKAIIGMRSGFLECLSQNNVPLFALYTDFPKRFEFKRLASNKVLSGFTISKLPNVNTDMLFEYDMNKYNDKTDVILDISKKIKEFDNSITQKN